MNTGVVSPERSGVRVMPGRSLAFSPEWHEEGMSVLFDRNSGDYWVVSSLARKLVEELVGHDEQCATELVRRTLTGFADDAEVTPEIGDRILRELIQLDILAAAPDCAFRTDRDTPLA